MIREEVWGKLENRIIVWFDYGLVVVVSTSLRFNLIHRSGEAFVRPMLDIAILNCSSNAIEP